MNKSKLLITVIVPTHNRCESLKDTLSSLLEQACDNNFDYEIIVVDNNSKDKTREVVEEYKAKFKKKLRYIFERKQGVSSARNRGIKEARGEIIAFTDDDCIVDKYWLVNIWNCFRKYNCDAVGGRVLPLYPKNTPKWIVANKDILSGPIPYHDYGEETKIYVRDRTKFRMRPFIGANMAFRKKCFNENGYFLINLGPGRGIMGEDSEFFGRLERNNVSIYYCGESIVYHKIEKERLKWRYIADWFIKLGRYSAIEEKICSPNQINFLFGAPRYIFKEMMQDSFWLFFGLIIKEKKILKKIIRFFWNVGKIIEFRKLYKYKNV